MHIHTCKRLICGNYKAAPKISCIFAHMFPFTRYKYLNAIIHRVASFLKPFFQTLPDGYDGLVGMRVRVNGAFGNNFNDV